MSAANCLALIDAGNTSIKIGIIEDEQLKHVRRFSINDIAVIRKFLFDNKVSNAVISSVLSKENTQKLTSLFERSMFVSNITPLPIELKYDTPQTLGVDRISNACYAAKNADSDYSLVIDIGTCVKFDLSKKEGDYLGGSISPGVDLRFRSLNDYTGNLPLLSNKSAVKLVGTDTDTSIRSGVINGMQAEIQGMINDYERRYESLTFFVTGGDAKYFDLHAKNDIFADENLTLLGLYEIYKHNA